VNTPYKSIALWVLVIITFLMAYNMFHKPVDRRQPIPYSEFLDKVENQEVAQVEIQGEQITGTLKDETPFETYAPYDPDLIGNLRENGVGLAAQPEPEEPLWKSILISWVPMLLLIGLWFFAMRQMQSGTGKAMSFGKSRAKLMGEGQKPVTFKDVAGVDEAKDELEEIVHFLKDPSRFTKFGGRIPKGVLLVGSPGTGKTLLARAVAGEAGVPFYTISGSDFVEMFVGVGASRVRDLFLQAKKSAPCIVFIDEIDAVGRHRGAGLGGGHDEREQTLNQLLVEMDGFEANEGIILMAATNRPDVLDPALLRPGRFDRRVVVPLPDWQGRLKILEVHIAKKKVPIAAEIDLEVIARGTPGFSGADVENIVNEAALVAARNKDRSEVLQKDFEEAKDKVMMGAERRSIALSDKEKLVTAYHEVGHALVARMLPESDPVHKITIIPRGMALGLTMTVPDQDMHTYTRTYLTSRLAMMMGGRAAEELIFGERTTGAGNDIERASDIARKMVCQWGMSEAIGPWGLNESEQEVFLGRDLAKSQNMSAETSALVDKEVRSILDAAYETAKKVLTDNAEGLEAVSRLLLERETISGKEMDELLASLGVELPDVASEGPIPENVAPVPHQKESEEQTNESETAESASDKQSEKDASEDSSSESAEDTDSSANSAGS
jgi:cell division protease FtsH